MSHVRYEELIKKAMEVQRTNVNAKKVQGIRLEHNVREIGMRRMYCFDYRNRYEDLPGLRNTNPRMLPDLLADEIAGENLVSEIQTRIPLIEGTKIKRTYIWDHEEKPNSDICMGTSKKECIGKDYSFIIYDNSTDIMIRIWKTQKY